MEWLEARRSDSLVRLFIQPGASRNEVTGLHGDRLKVKIKAPPVDHGANIALIEFMSELLGVAKSKIRIIRGETSRQKDLLIEVPSELVRELLSKTF